VSYWLLVWQDSFQVPLANTLRQGTIAAIQIVRSLVFIGTTIWLVELDAGLVAFCGALIPGMAVALALTILLVRHEVPLAPRLRAREWRPILYPLLPLAAAVLLGLAYYRLGAVALSVLSSDEQTGYFGAAFRAVDAVVASAPVLLAAAIPVLARMGKSGADALARAAERLFAVGLVVAVALSVAVIAGAPAIIAVVAGPGFGPAVEVLRILGVGLAGRFVVTMLAYVALSQHRYRQMLICTGAAFTVFAVTSLALIPPLGAVGAAIALTLAEVTSTIAYFLYLRRAWGFAPRALFLVKVGLAWALGLGAGLLFGLSGWLAAPLAVLVYTGVLLATGGVPRDVWLLVPHRWGGPAANDAARQGAGPEGKGVGD
jgi:O-antigen/teichoic acid export membrane protein